MESSAPATVPVPPARQDRLWLALIFLGGVLVALHGILRTYTFAGQDFQYHLNLIAHYPDGYSYRETNPPALYWLGALIWHRLAPDHPVETLGVVLLALNLAALWGIYRLIWDAIASRPLRFAAAALVTFVPCRMIHSMIISSDAFTIPTFTAAALCTVALGRNPRRPVWWAALATVLSLGMVMKYSLVGLLPPIALILGGTLWRHRDRGGWFRPTLALGLALGLPAVIFLLEMRESDKVQGATTYGHWKVPGTPSIMRWEDILLLKPSDRRLFSAPEYFRDKLYENRAYSYAALLHLTVFTDAQNFMQPVAPGVRPSVSDRYHAELGRARTPRSQQLQVWSVRWTLPLSVLALAGTLVGIARAVPAILFDWRSPRAGAVVLAALGFGLYAPIFFSFTQLGDPYTPGYWLPRLVLPSIVCFLCLGLWLVDLAVSALGRWPRVQAILPRLALAHVVVACVLFVGFLR